MKRVSQTLGVLALLIGLFAALSPVRPVAAADAVVTTCDEASFDAALDTVQRSGGGVITFACTGTITFTSEKTIDRTVTITGNGAVIIDGNNSTLLFDANGPDATLEIDNMILQNGRGFPYGAVTTSLGTVIVRNSTVRNVRSEDGAIGCIFGACEIDSTTFSNNRGGGSGGAIYSNQADITITNSTFANNDADFEGGAINIERGTASIVASTFNGNTSFRGGAISNEGGDLTITSSTLSGNSATSWGGGIYSINDNPFTAATTIAASIVANNSAPSGPNCFRQSGSITSSGYNLSNSAGDCNFNATGDRPNNGNVNLGALADYGGRTQTMRPQPGSTAIDNADCELATTTDQRGGPRPDSNCDIGAVEVQANPFVPIQILALHATTSPNVEGSPTSITAAALAGLGVSIEFHFDCDNNGSGETPGTDTGNVSTAECVFNDSGIRTVGVVVDHPRNPSLRARWTAPIFIENVAPTITSVSSTSPINEGGQSRITVEASDPAGFRDPLTIWWDCDNDGTYDVHSINQNYHPCPFEDDGEFTVTVRVDDDDGGSTIDSTTVTVENVAPTLNTPSVAPSPSTEGESVTASATFSDPGSDDTHSCTVDYGDGTGAQGGTVSGNTCTGPAHTYTDDGTFTVAISVEDDDGGSVSETVSHSVNNAAPTIIEIITNSPVTEGETVTVQVLTTDPGGSNDVQMFAFDCDDDGSYEIGPQTANSAECSFPEVGEYPINVLVSDDDGGEVTGSTIATVTSVPPTVETPDVSPSPSTEGQAVTASADFSDPGIDDTHTCTVDYGDGSGPLPGTIPGTTCIGPIHTYADDGLYTVTIVVTDNHGEPGSNSASHTVDNLAPTISEVSNSGPVGEGSPATISVTASDPGTDDSLLYAFDCDGDGSYEIGPQAANSAECAYDDDGIFTVNVEVTDGDGGVDSGSTIVTVDNVAPTIEPLSVNPSPSDEGQSVVASASFTDPGAADTHTCTVDYDDGDGPQAGVISNGTCTGPANTYPDDGQHTIQISVTDDEGGNDQTSSAHTVDNVPPTISDVSNDGPIEESETATVTVTASDPAGVNDPLSYRFDCNDDEIYEIGPQAANSAGCFFAEVGIYTVNVEVSDDDGGATTDNTEVIVGNIAPLVDAPAVDPSPSDEGQSVIASAAFNDPGDIDTHTCSVDYGDASGPQNGGVADNTCTGPAHTYAEDGQYTVTVVVTDNHGESGSNSANHTVDNVAPIIDSITANGPNAQGQPVSLTVVASDPGGSNDPLTYAFDCDNDGSYETPGAGNAALCPLDPNIAVTTIGVQVSDDDGGVIADSIEVGQSLTLCGRYTTGELSLPSASGCLAGTLALELPGASPTTLCVNLYTLSIVWSPRGCSASGWLTHVVPDSGPLQFCVHNWTGGLRANLSGGACNAYERPGVIPGNVPGTLALRSELIVRRGLRS